mmetsp:Transcript_54253/g.100293  ORF Transcript_54253/g.100293 Transcript_54253/m.100293 type:complete len:218 (+) Transcript_54253:341-994(+)
MGQHSLLHNVCTLFHSKRLLNKVPWLISHCITEDEFGIVLNRGDMGAVIPEHDRHELHPIECHWCYTESMMSERNIFIVEVHKEWHANVLDRVVAGIQNIKHAVEVKIKHELQIMLMNADIRAPDVRQSSLHSESLPVAPFQHHYGRGCWELTTFKQQLQVCQVGSIPVRSILRDFSSLPSALLVTYPEAVANEHDGTVLKTSNAREASQDRLKHHG